jgi:hypothetical protein
LRDGETKGTEEDRIEVSLGGVEVPGSDDFNTRIEEYLLCCLLMKEALREEILSNEEGICLLIVYSLKSFYQRFPTNSIKPIDVQVHVIRKKKVLCQNKSQELEKGKS